MGAKEEHASRAINNRRSGLCGCGREPKPTSKSCERCSIKQRDAMKARRKLPGHCKLCGKQLPPAFEFKRCDRCRPRVIAHQAASMARKRDRGECIRCATRALADSVFCELHRARNRLAAAAGMRRLKQRQKEKQVTG